MVKIILIILLAIGFVIGFVLLIKMQKHYRNEQDIYEAAARERHRKIIEDNEYKT